MMPEIKVRNRTLEITQCGFSLILRTREVEWLPHNHILSYVYLSFHKHLPPAKLCCDGGDITVNKNGPCSQGASVLVSYNQESTWMPGGNKCQERGIESALEVRTILSRKTFE